MISDRTTYLQNLACAAAKNGRGVLDTATRAEQREVKAILHRAGLKLPPRRVEYEERVEELVRDRLAEAKRQFVNAVGIARAIYRMGLDQDRHYGSHLITSDAANLPKWFLELAGEVDLDGVPIPGESAAFSNREKLVRDEIVQRLKSNQ